MEKIQLRIIDNNSRNFITSHGNCSIFNRKGMKKCDILGHKWTQVYIKGDYNGQTVKFIGCYCTRCLKGNEEIHKISNAAKNRKFSTYNQKYFIRRLKLW